MNGNMNGKDFFELLGDLDEDIVEDAWTEKSGIVTIVEERSPLSFLKIAAAAAACIALMTVGVYGALKFRHNDIVPPSDSDVTYIESSLAESSESESSSEENSDAENPRSEEDIKFTALERYGANAPYIDVKQFNPGFSVQKFDSINFAVFNVERTNATEDKPVYITVCCSDYSGFDFIDPVSEKIKITGPGKYVARYEEKFPALSMSYIYVETCGEEYGDGGYIEFDGLIIEGQWMP